jgi:hypothetical protein
LLPLIDNPLAYTPLISVVYRNGSYWLFGIKSLYNDFGKADDFYDHEDAAWLNVRFQN